MMKFILGTVQFGMPYGVVNTQGVQPCFEEVVDTFNCAWDHHIRTLDSAMAYGAANERIADYHRKTSNRFNVINKIIRYPLSSIDEFETVKTVLKAQLKQMDLPHFEVVMLHYAASIVRPFVQQHLNDLLEEGIALKVGLSISSESEYRLLARDFQFQVIQLPLNILNRVLMTDAFLSELKEQHIEIHARSVLMQGLLACGHQALPPHLQALTPYLLDLESFAATEGCSLQALALAFAMQHPSVDQIVFGVQSKQELMAMIRSIQEAEKYTRIPNAVWRDFACSDQSLVDPAQWASREKK